MNETRIQIANKNLAALLQYEFGHGKGLYADEELVRIKTILQCIRENGFDIVIQAIQPKDCHITSTELMAAISACLGIYDAWTELLTPAEKYNTFTKREKQLFRLLANNANPQVSEITNLKEGYLSKVRQRLNGKSNCHSPAELMEFFRIVLNTGADIPIWNPKMRKRKFVAIDP